MQAATNEPFILRRLGALDAASYRELRLEGLKTHPEAFGASFDDEASKPLSWFQDRLENNMVFGGYTDDGTLVGVAGFRVPASAKSSHKGFLWGMFLKPEVRGTGLAKLLVKRVVEQAENVVEEILLTVVVSNIAAVQLYKGLGFEEYGLERRALKIGNHYHDELLMALPLKNLDETDLG